MVRPTDTIGPDERVAEAGDPCPREEKQTISIIAPILNEATYLDPFLQALRLQSYPRDRFEVLIADGGSTDGTLEILRQFMKENPDLGVRLWECPGVSKRARLNVCVRAAAGEIIARIDGGHSFPATDYLEAVNRAFWRLRDQPVLAVGGPVRLLERGFWGRAIAVAMRSRFAVGQVPYREVGREGFVRTVQNASYHRSAFERFGLFDEQILGGEDGDFHWRLLRGGFKIFLTPAIRFYYYPRDSVRGLFRQFLHYGRGRVRVLRKHPDFGSFKSGVAALFVLALLSAPGMLWAPAWMQAVYGAGLATYGVASAVSSILDCRRSRWRYLPVFPLLYFVMHFGYGMGVVLECLHIRFLLDDSDTPSDPVAQQSPRPNQETEWEKL